MAWQCGLCGAHLDRYPTHVIFPGVEQGSLDITGEKPLCGACAKALDDSAQSEKFILIGMLMGAGRTDEAIRVLTSFFNPQKDTHWYHLGNLFRTQGSPGEAGKCFDHALLLNTHFLKAWYRKGRLLLSGLDFEGASSCFRNVLELDPENRQGWNRASKFHLMCCSIGLHNRAERAGKKSEVAYQEVQKWVMECIDIYSDALSRGLVSADSGLSGFHHYCLENQDALLEQLEPRIAMTAPKGSTAPGGPSGGIDVPAGVPAAMETTELPGGGREPETGGPLPAAAGDPSGTSGKPSKGTGKLLHGRARGSGSWSRKTYVCVIFSPLLGMMAGVSAGGGLLELALMIAGAYLGLYLAGTMVGAVLNRISPGWWNKRAKKS